MGDLVIKAAASNSLKIQSDNATNVLTVGTDDSVTLGTEFKVTSTSQTFTIKGIDAAITDSQTGSDPNVADSDSGQLAIYNGSTKLWRISEHGYVVNPNVPHFHVEKSDVTSYTSTGEIVFNVSVLDNTSSYSTSTGRFTAPISGAYFLAFYGLKRNSSSINGGFAKNGSQYRMNTFYQQHEDGSDQNMVHISIIMELSAGDYASVRLDSIGGGDFYFGSNKHNGFLGYLIG